MPKRFFDLAVSFLGLIALSPLFAMIAICTKLESRGPVFFRGERVGRAGKPFLIFKFRSMVANAGAIGPELTVSSDQRITRVGAVLRRSKLDELPQLLNVIKGDMSLVGPRPEVRRYVDMFADEYEELLEIRPGITDLASLQYRRESEELDEAGDPEAYYIDKIMPEKIRLAHEYRSRSSLLFDARIIFRTITRIAQESVLLDAALLVIVLLVIAAAVLYPDSFIPGGPGFGSMRMTPLSLLSPFVLLFGLVYLITWRKRLKANAVDASLIVFMAFFVARNLAGTSAIGSLKYSLYGLVIFYLCAYLSRRVSYLRAVIYTIVFLAFITAFYGVFVEYVLQRNVLFFPLISEVVKEPPQGLHRIGSTLAHPVAYGAFLVQVAPFCVFLVLRSKDKFIRLFGGAASVMVLLALFLNYSKGSWLAALLLSLICFTFMLFRSRSRDIYFVSLLALVASVFTLVFWNQISSEVSVRTGLSIEGRQFGWDAAVTTIEKHPLLGVGLWNGQPESFSYLSEAMQSQSLHMPIDNYYLTLLAEEGIVGFSLWMLFIAAIIKRGFKAAASRRGESTSLLFALVLSVLGLTLNAITYEAMFVWSNLIIFWVSAGLLRGLLEDKTKITATTEPT